MWPLYGSGDIKDMQGPRELQGLGDRLVLFALEGRPAPATLFELFALICFLQPPLFPSGLWGRDFSGLGPSPLAGPFTRKAATFHLWAFCSHMDHQITGVNSTYINPLVTRMATLCSLKF